MQRSRCLSIVLSHDFSFFSNQEKKKYLVSLNSQEKKYLVSLLSSLM